MLFLSNFFSDGLVAAGWFDILVGDGGDKMANRQTFFLGEGGEGGGGWAWNYLAVSKIT